MKRFRCQKCDASIVEAGEFQRRRCSLCGGELVEDDNPPPGTNDDRTSSVMTMPALQAILARALPISAEMLAWDRPALSSGQPGRAFEQALAHLITVKAICKMGNGWRPAELLAILDEVIG